MAKEKEKCEKTILNKLTGETIFKFKGSKKLIDFLTNTPKIQTSAEEDDEVETESWQQVFASALLINSKYRKSKENTKKGKEKKKAKDVDPLSFDQKYLKNLEKNLMPIQGLEQEW